MQIPLVPKTKSSWANLAVPFTDLAQCLIGSTDQLSLAIASSDGPVTHFGTTGNRGEAEFVRRCVDNDALNVFRAFPDTEFVEYVVRNVDTHKMIGVQVKCGRVNPGKPDTAFLISPRTLTPADNSYLVGLVEIAPNTTHSECLLLPSKLIPELASLDEGYWRIWFSPYTVNKNRLDQFRIPTAELADHLERLVA